MKKITLLPLIILALSGCSTSSDDSKCSGNECSGNKLISNMRTLDGSIDLSDFRRDVEPVYNEESSTQELLQSVISITKNDTNTVGLSNTEKPEIIEANKSDFTARRNNIEALGTENTIKPMALTPNYNPGCYTFGVNVFTQLNASPNASYCIYYEIQQKSRVQFFQLNQSNQFTNSFNILVNQDVNGDYNLSYVTQSNGSPIMHLDPGHYYVFYSTPAGVTTTNAVKIGASVNTANVDSYEPNDTLASAFVTSNIADIADITGTLDFSGDIDYFNFDSDNGQVIRSVFSSSDNSHKLEVLRNASWVELGYSENLTPQNGPTVIKFRVRTRVNGVVNPSATYSWRVGSLVSRISDVRAWSDENLVKASGMFRKFHNELKWKAKALDSTNNVIRGAVIAFDWRTFDLGINYDSKITGADGYARGVITVPDCQGDNKIDRKDYLTGHMWKIEYDTSRVGWRSLDNTAATVGHTNVILNAYHSCNEDLRFTKQHMDNGGWCSESITYCPADYISAPNPNPSRIYNKLDLMWKSRAYSHELRTYDQ